MAKSAMKTVGVWAFIIGVGLALIVGIGAAFSGGLEGNMGMISTLMAVLGLIVGILNVTDDEVNSFVIAAIGLSVGSSVIAGIGPLLGGTLGTMVESAFRVFGVFVASAVFIPALKAVYKISKD